MGGSGREREPRQPPGLGGSPPTWVEAAARGVGRVTRANTHPALRPSPATPASRAASAPPRPVTRGRPDRHSLFPGAGRRPAGPTCPARRGAAVGLGVRGGPRPASSTLAPALPAARPPPRSRAAPEPRGRKGGAAPLRASLGRGPLRRFQNTLPGWRASRGGGVGRPRGHQSPARAGRAAPGAAGRKGWAGGRLPSSAVRAQLVRVDPQPSALGGRRAAPSVEPIRQRRRGGGGAGDAEPG